MLDKPATLRKPTNLSIDTSLIDEARALGINLSRSAEAGISKAITERRSGCGYLKTRMLLRVQMTMSLVTGFHWPSTACSEWRDTTFISTRTKMDLLDVQASILRTLTTRVMVPLLQPDRAPKPARRLNPPVALAGQDYVMVTPVHDGVYDVGIGRSRRKSVRTSRRLFKRPGHAVQGLLIAL